MMHDASTFSASKSKIMNVPNVAYGTDLRVTFSISSEARATGFLAVRLFALTAFSTAMA